MSVRKEKLVVLDTNIIVSGFLDGDKISYPSKIISAWLTGELQVVDFHYFNFQFFTLKTLNLL